MAEENQDPNDDVTEEPIEEVVQEPEALDKAEAEEAKKKRRKSSSVLPVKQGHPHGWPPSPTWRPCSWHFRTDSLIYRNGGPFYYF